MTCDGELDKFSAVQLNGKRSLSTNLRYESKRQSKMKSNDKSKEGDLAPIFFIGAPRSGTTVSFELFTAHPDLAWVTNYDAFFPRLPAVNLLRSVLDNRWINLRAFKNQWGQTSRLHNFLPRAAEAYPFWNAHGCANFSKSFLQGQAASKAEAESLTKALSKVRKYQFRPRVTTKMTGPGRISYLHSVWPQMFVVHVIRDGLDVARSLLNVGFWKERGGYEKLWWEGGVSNEEFDRWKKEGSEPGALAALQWRRIIETTREEAQKCLGDRYIELRYEQFRNDPLGTIKRVYEKVGLSPERAQLNPLQMRNKSYGQEWDDDYRQSLVKWMQPLYTELGYTA